MPFDKVEKLNADLIVRLSLVPRLPIFGFPPKVVPPQVRIALGDRRPFVLTAAGRVAPFERVWGPSAKPREIDFELLRGRVDEASRPRMAEKTIAWKQIKRVPIAAKKPIPLQLEIVAPEGAQPGTNFYLRIEQEVGCDVTGCYTVVISIV